MYSSQGHLGTTRGPMINKHCYTIIPDKDILHNIQDKRTRYIFYEVISRITRWLPPAQQLASEEHISVEEAHRRPDRHKSWNLQIKFYPSTVFQVTYNQPCFIWKECSVLEGKSKVVPLQTMLPGIQYSRKRGVSGQLPSLPGKEPWCPLNRRLGGSPQLVWTYWGWQNLNLPGLESRIFQSVT